MIQQGENTYKTCLMEMWKLSFPLDNDEFIHFYFNEVYKNEETLLYLKDKEPVASLQILPYRIKTGTTIHTAGYISGVMTHPDHRKKGYMGELLQAAFKAMQKKGYHYTFLIPQEKWLSNFYEKYGYIKGRMIQACPVVAHHLSSTVPPFINCYSCLEEIDFPSFYATYSRFLSEKSNVVLKTEMQTKHILQDFFLEKGILFANNQGVAFTFAEGNEIKVKEFLYHGLETRNHFLHGIALHYNRKKIIFFDASDESSLSGHSGMIKNLIDSADLPTNIYISMMLD